MAELQPLAVDQQEPMGAHPLDPHLAALPGPGAEAALERNRARRGPGGGATGQEKRQQRGGAPAARGWMAREGTAHGRSCCISSNLQRRGDRGRGRLPRFNKRLPPVPLFRARVLVSLRPSVLDPAGEATRAAAARLGVEGVRRLRIGKAIELELEAPDHETARARLEQLSDRLLANPVIEDWTLELGEGAASVA
jgi:phosphoribosylformylglycinamidine synthase